MNRLKTNLIIKNKSIGLNKCYKNKMNQLRVLGQTNIKIYKNKLKLNILDPTRFENEFLNNFNL